MRKSSWRFLPSLAVLGVFVVGGGCGLKTAESPTHATDAGGAPDKGKESTSVVGQIMFQIGRGPRALTGSLDKALKSDKPDWDSIQTFAKELKKLTSDLTKLDPPRGSKESWQQLTVAFSDAAGALDEAAQAKDLEAARKADDLLNGSCMKCHNEHKKKGKGG
jgi:hypothetical protein